MEELWRKWLDGRLDIVFPSLRCEHTFGFITVSLAFAIFLVRVLDRDFFVHEILTVHVGDCFVRGLEIGKGDEAIAL